MFLPRQPMNTAPQDRNILLHIHYNGAVEPEHVVARFQDFGLSSKGIEQKAWIVGGHSFPLGDPMVLGWWELPNTILTDSYSMADAVNRHMQAIVPLCKIKGYAALALAGYVMINPDGTLNADSGITAITSQDVLKPEERDLLIRKLRQVLDGLN